MRSCVAARLAWPMTTGGNVVDAHAVRTSGLCAKTCNATNPRICAALLCTRPCHATCLSRQSVCHEARVLTGQSVSQCYTARVLPSASALTCTGMHACQGCKGSTGHSKTSQARSCCHLSADTPSFQLGSLLLHSPLQRMVGTHAAYRTVVSPLSLIPFQSAHHDAMAFVPFDTWTLTWFTSTSLSTQQLHLG